MKKHILILFVALCVWLLCLNLILLLSHFIPLRAGYIHPLFSWANFDGIHYLAIAKNGYTNNMRFMPLYPILIHFLGGWTDYFWAAYILSQLFFFFALLFLYKLFRLDYSPRKSLALTLVLLLLPTSFFFTALYTEGLFLLLTVLAFYSARRRNWMLAALCGFLASSTRIIGFLIVIPLLIEYLKYHKIKKIRYLIVLFAIPLGAALYAIYNFIKWGNPLLFIQAHSQLSNGRSSTKLVLFPQTIYRYFKMLTTVSPSLWEWKIALLELTTFIVACICVYVLWRQKVRLSYVVYIILSLLVPASSGTFTGLPRYIVVLFPLLITFSRIRSRAILICILTCSFVLQLILFLYFSRGYFVA